MLHPSTTMPPQLDSFLKSNYESLAIESTHLKLLLMLPKYLTLFNFRLLREVSNFNPHDLTFTFLLHTL